MDNGGDKITHFGIEIAKQGRIILKINYKNNKSNLMPYSKYMTRESNTKIRLINYIPKNEEPL